MTDYNLDISLQNRKILRRLLSATPHELLFTIPDGFRNNIWWNICHILATQQILVYQFSGLPTRVPEHWIDKYKKGTKPSETVDKEAVVELGELLLTSVEAIREDYHAGNFKEYEEYTTSTKVTIGSVEDAISFNNFHEGYHLATVVSLLKVLGIFPYSD